MNRDDADARMVSPLTVKVPILSPPPGATAAPTTVRIRRIEDAACRYRRPVATIASSVFIMPSMFVQPVTWLNSAQTLRLPLAPMFSLAWLLSIVSLSIVALTTASSCRLGEA